MASMQLWIRSVLMLYLSDQLDLLGLLREEGEPSSVTDHVKRKLDLRRWILYGRGHFSFSLGFFLSSGLWEGQVIRLVPPGGGCQDVVCHMDASQELGWALATAATSALQHPYDFKVLFECPSLASVCWGEQRKKCLPFLDQNIKERAMLPDLS